MVRPSTGLALLLSVALATSGAYAANSETSNEQATTPGTSPQQGLTSARGNQQVGLILPAVQTIRESANR